MGWSKKAYAFGVVVRSGHHLRSWPTYANIPFADPSAIPGGQPTMRFLLALWDVGILRFEPATAEEIDLARRNPDAVLPGAPPALPAPFCWGPFGRNDIGLGRPRPKTNPLGLPLRRPKNGPKTPKLLLDSDVEDDEISETESHGELEARTKTGRVEHAVAVGRVLVCCWRRETRETSQCRE